MTKKDRGVKLDFEVFNILGLIKLALSRDIGSKAGMLKSPLVRKTTLEA